MSLATSAGVGFSLWRKSVALLERLHLQRIDRVDNAIELILQLRRGLDVEVAREHQINGAIEVGFCFRKLSTLVIGFALGIRLLNLRDQRLNLLLLRIDLRRRGLLWRRTQ